MPYRHCWNCRKLVFHAEVRLPEPCPRCADPLEHEPAALFPGGARVLRNRAALEVPDIETEAVVQIDARSSVSA